MLRVSVSGLWQNTVLRAAGDESAGGRSLGRSSTGLGVVVVPPSVLLIPLPDGKKESQPAAHQAGLSTYDGFYPGF